jgi:two-component system capsular synthesis sensor histidine kinase RcsC
MNKSADVHSGAVLIDVFGSAELPFQWSGRTITCLSDGSRVAERTDNGLRVSAHFVKAIANALMMEKNQQSVTAAAPLNSAWPSLNLNVLVAEDNLINQAILKEQLEALGCNVLLAGNGLQALKLWEQECFDAVLTDVNMPVLSGYELARSIRETDTDLPIFGITANAMRDEGERCLAAGMNAWLVKPLSLADLLRVLASLKSDDVAVIAQPSARLVSAVPIVLSEAMRALFQSTMQTDMASARSALGMAQVEELAQVLHSVSGALAVVRADQLSASFAQLEYKVRDQRLDAELIGEVEQALSALEDLVSSL